MPGVAREQRPQAERDDDLAPRQSRAAPPARPGEARTHSQAERRADEEAPADERQPVDAGRVDRRGKDRARSVTGRRDDHQADAHGRTVDPCAARLPARNHRAQGRYYTSSVTDLTEGVVARRVPSLTDERLRVLSRRHPVTVAPGTSLADCLRAIQRTGTGDSVFVCDPDGRLSAC